jgi:hypothetical protein
MVPKILHYLWIGPYEDPETAHNDWTKVLPGYNKLIWNNTTARNYIFEAANLLGNLEGKSFTYLSDVVRLLILRDYGGIYIDHDIVVLKDFSPLIEDCSLVLTYQYANPDNNQLPNYSKGFTLAEVIEKEYSLYDKTSSSVNNCFIAVEKDHRFITSALNITVTHHSLPKENQYAMMDWGVGPDVFTLIAQQYGFNTTSCLTETIDNIRILSSEHLHAVHGNIRT